MSNPFDQFDAPAAEGGNPFDQFDAPAAKKLPSKGILSDVGGAFVEGAKSAGRAIAGTANIYAGDESALVEKAQAQESAQAQKPAALTAFNQAVTERVKPLGDDPGLLDSVKAIGGAVVDQPKGAGLAVVEQLPNAAPAIAGGMAGMKAGAALGTAIMPGVGTTIGAIGGGLAGMFLGNTAIETGYKGIEAAQDGAVTQDEMSRVKKEGAVKAGVITGVDALTLGLSKAVTNIPARAVESATRNALTKAGVNVADEAAVLAARQSPEISAAVRAAQESAFASANTLGKRAAAGGAALGLETVGEGLGEYLGELAATGKANIADAVLEAMMSLGQSGAEVAWGAARNKKAEQGGMWDTAEAKFQPPPPTLVTEPEPLQQRIDALMGIDTGAMSDKERTQYEKDLTAAFLEPVGVTQDEHGLEIPFTMADYLNAQVRAEDSVRARPLKQNAADQSGNRLQQLADEETQQQPDIPGYVAPVIPVVGALSAAANMAVQSGAHAAHVAQQQVAIQNSQAEASGTQPGKADTPTTGNREAAPQLGILAGIAAQAPSIAQSAPNTQPQGQGGMPATAQQGAPVVTSPARVENGQPGWREAATAEIQRRGVQISQAQQSNTDAIAPSAMVNPDAPAANSASVPALNAADSANRFDAKGLQPGTPEYNAAYQAWMDSRSQNREDSSKNRQREENQSAIDKKNKWRNKLRDWFNSAEDGDSITDVTGQRYVVVTKVRRDGTSTKTLIAVDDSGVPLPDGRAATGVAKIGDRLDGLNDGSLDVDTGSAHPESAGQSFASSLGQQLETGEAKTGKSKSNIPNGDGITSQAPAITALQHVENGKAEPATSAVVEQSLKKGADNSPLDLRQERDLLLKKVDQAIAAAPTAEEKGAWDKVNQKIDLTNNMHVDETIGYRGFDVPGDGKFKVLNLKEALQRFRERVEASPGFKKPSNSTGLQTVAPWQRTTTGGTEATTKELLDAGEYSAAVEYAKQIGKPLVFGQYQDGSSVTVYTDSKPFEHDGYDDFKMVSARNPGAADKVAWSVIDLNSGLTISSQHPTRLKVIAETHKALEKMTPEQLATGIKSAKANNSWLVGTQDELEARWLENVDAREADAQAIAEAKNRKGRISHENQSNWKRIDDAVKPAAPAAEEQKAAIKADSINGFLDGKAPMQAGAIRNALNKQWRFDGVVMTARDRIESLWRDGKLAVSTYEENKIKPMSRRDFNRASQREQDAHEKKMREAGTKTVYVVSESELGKIAHDYAQHLLAKNAEVKPSEVAIELGGGQIAAKLEKPLIETTKESLIEQIKQQNLQGWKDGNLRLFTEKHGESIKAAMDAGKTVPDDVLADYPGLIRDDLTDDQRDKMADDLAGIDGAERTRAIRAWSPKENREYAKQVDNNSQRNFRNIDALNPLTAPVEDGNWFNIGGKDWQARNGYTGRGWALIDADKKTHPTINNIDANADLIREIVQANESAKSGDSNPTVAAEKPAESKAASATADAGEELTETDRGVAVYNIAERNASLSAADKAVYGMGAEGKNTADILKFIASASRNPMNRQIAKLLLKTGIAPQVMAGNSDGWKFNAGNDKKYAAAYNPKANTVALFRPASAERHVLHELMHAATLKALNQKGMAAGQMKALFAHVEKVGRAQGLFYDKATGRGVYGMADIDEFVAEAFTNPKFQEALKKVSAQKSSGTLSTAWNWFVRVVRGILGIPQGQENALSQALEIGVEVMREDMALRKSEGGASAYTERMAKDNLDPDDAEAMRVQKAIEGKSTIDVAQWISVSGSPSERMIAGKVLSRLKMLESAGVNLKFKVAHVGDSIPRSLLGARGITTYKFGKADPSVDVWINGADVTGKVGTSVRTVLHELVHAATMGAVRLGGLKVAAGSKLAADVADLYAVTNSIIGHFNRRVADSKAGKITLTDFEQQMFNSENNAFRDVHETLAWALTDVDAQSYLESIPYQSKSAWTSFVSAIRQFLGLSSSADTALSEVLRVSEAIMSDNINDMIAMSNITGTAMATQESSDQMILSDHHGSDAIRYATGPKQTDSAAFRKWFGDSKVVDANGDPLVVYHGTGATDISEFKVSTSGTYGGGIYLTPEIRGANDYAIYRGAPSSTVYPVYAAIKNPASGSEAAQVASWKGEENAREELIKRGYDGVVDMRSGEIVAFYPEQIKSAIGNNGDFDPNNQDIRYNVADEGWSVAEPSKMDDVIYALQDKQIDMKRVVQSIMKTGKQIKDDFNAYLQEELFHGRAAKGVKDFLDFELRPLLKQMQEAKVDMGDFEEYLWNRHAEERNKQIAKINPDMPDGGSGIETAKARAYLAGLSVEQRKTFEALAAKVEAMNRESQRVLIESGLEKQSTIDAWNNAYQHYVPLQREDVDSGHVGTGKGFSVRGSSSKRAMGSGRQVVDIIANLTMQRERNIVRAEKNRVSNALLGLAVQNPNPDFWKVDQAPKERVVNNVAIYNVLDANGKKVADFTKMDEADRMARNIGGEVEQTWGDRVQERIEPGFTSRDNVLLTRINGDDHYVIFNERDERAMRMAMAMKNLDVDNLGRVLSIVGKATRYLASINTQYNPVFGVINLIRDAQGALINLSSTALAGEQKRVLGYTKDALVGIYRDIRAHRAGKKPSSNWAALFEEFQKEGGQTGYRDQYANAEARAEAIKAELEQFKDGKAKQFTRGLFGWLSDYNETMENAVRLAVYAVAKEKGMSKQQAASLAKNVTVNFNRKGQMATQVGALYAFFNASVQGTARIAETLFEQHGGDIKNVRLSKKGKQIVLGGIMLGSMQALLLAAAGYDDDEPPEFVRERNLILPVGDGKYLTLAMPLGLHVIPGIGRIATEFVLSGGKDPLKRIAAFGSMFADAFNPVGSAGWSLQTITPSVVDPFAALAENKDFTGKEIYREDFNKLSPTPGHARAKDVATIWSRFISEILNRATGGTEFKPGMFSPSPDSIDYLIAQAGGGVMREANKVAQTVGATATGEDLPLYKIPLVGRFVGDTAGQSGQSQKFYEAIKQINMHEAQYKGLIKDGRSTEAREYLAENPAVKLIMAGNHAELAVRKLRTMKRDLVENDADQAQIRAIDDRITATMKAFNERAKAAI